MGKIQYLILALFFLSCSKKNPWIPIQTGVPSFEIFADTLIEGIDDFLLLSVHLKNKIETPILIEYETSSASAIAGEDFEHTSGLMYFSTDTLSHKQNILINLIDDEKQEETEIFEIIFRTDTLANFNNERVQIIILDDDDQLTDNDFPGYVTPLEYEGWNLFWADEFSGTELNLEDWIQANSGNWFNNELQYYTPNNTEVGNGVLTITAKPEVMGGHNYTSSRMWTHHKVFFNYGRVDIRAKLPYSQGLWPALWMMGENRDTVGWAQCGEIDIMELRGHTPNTVSSTIHYKNAGGNNVHPTAKKYVLESESFDDEFYVFSLIWNEHKVEFFVDDILYNTIFHPNLNYLNNDNPFLKEFYILMNVAVGGNFGGNPDATTIWPQKMEVDYVRVFQKE